MFNSKYKKEALAEADRASREYKRVYETVINDVEELHKEKQSGVEQLKRADEYVHSISNKPPEFEKTMSEIKVRWQAFEQEVTELEVESKKVDKIAAGTAGAGVMAGAGVAAFGPTAAMAIATTFGTASTGTAIATLSGAAATNAALAWLGGGALAAGGGGMAAGSTFLAMAGPVGWIIGGSALIGGGLMASSKNKKIAEKAEAQARAIKRETNELKKLKETVVHEKAVMKELIDGISKLITDLSKSEGRDYKSFSQDGKYQLQQLVNSANSLSKMLAKKLS